MTPFRRAATTARRRHAGPMPPPWSPCPAPATGAQALIAEACAVTDGPVVVDGAKTDGIDAMLKAVRGRATVDGPDRQGARQGLLASPATDAFADWAGPATATPRTASSPRPASSPPTASTPPRAALAEALPDKLGRTRSPISAPAGATSPRALLKRDGVETLAPGRGRPLALDCARAQRHRSARAVPLGRRRRVARAERASTPWS